MIEQYKPIVSVVVAVYNAMPYLRQCMDSIIAQSLYNIEILCVNDGSTDGSLDVLNTYAQADSRVKVYTKENEGLGGAPARNYGLELARGKYVSLLDSDDYFDAQMLEKAVARAETTDADIVVLAAMNMMIKMGIYTRWAAYSAPMTFPKWKCFLIGTAQAEFFRCRREWPGTSYIEKAFLTNTVCVFKESNTRTTPILPLRT